MNRRYIYSLSFVIPILTMLGVFFALKQYPFSEATINSGDFKNQYLPLYIGLKDLITSGNWQELFWSFSKSLGGTMASVWGFNSLSPFTLLYSLFPVEQFSLATVIITLLRYGCAGLAMSHLLIRRYQGDKERGWLTLVFAVIYALSGFMVAHQINPNFLDNLVYFPLVIIAVEEVLDGTYRGLWKYPLLLALIIITQFYTAYMICLFIVIYGLYYLTRVKGSISDKSVAFLKLTGLSIVGAALAAFWLLPVINALLESKASATETFEWSFNWLYDVRLLVSKFFVGSFDSAEWGASDAQPQLFIGSLGFLGVFHYFCNRHIDWKQKLAALAVLLLFVFSFTNDFGDKIWHMGQRPVGFYFRNAWIANLFCLLLAYQSLVKKYVLEKKSVLAIAGCGLLSAGLILGQEISYIEPWQIWVTGIFWLVMVVSFAFKPDKNIFAWLIIGITIVELGLNAWIGQSRTAYFITQPSIEQMTENHQLAESLISDEADDFYRMEVNKRPILANLPFVDDYQGVSHFTSSVEYALIENLGKLGLPTSKAFINYTNRMPFTDAILNMRYFVDDEPKNANQSDLLHTYHPLSAYGTDKRIYQNDYALSLGFAVPRAFNTYSLKAQEPGQVQADLMEILLDSPEPLLEQALFAKFSIRNLEANEQVFKAKNVQEERSISLHVESEKGYIYFIQVPADALYALKRSTVTLNGMPYQFADRFVNAQLWGIGPEPGQDGLLEFKLSSKDLDQYNMTDFKLYKMNIDAFKQAIKSKQADNLLIKSWSDARIEAEVTIEEGNNDAVFTSIPYNSGWQVNVDGKPVSTYHVWDTFMGFDLGKGHHQITMTYHPVGLLPGIGISLVALLVLAYLAFRSKKELHN